MTDERTRSGCVCEHERPDWRAPHLRAKASDAGECDRSWMISVCTSCHR